jgi:hypothetical protein
MSDVVLDSERVIVDANTLDIRGHDLFLRDRSRMKKPDGPQLRRALVHDFEDGLTINFNHDYPGGVTIHNLKVQARSLFSSVLNKPAPLETLEVGKLLLRLRDQVDSLEAEVAALKAKVP